VARVKTRLLYWLMRILWYPMRLTSIAYYWAAEKWNESANQYWVDHPEAVADMIKLLQEEEL
jgi:hypothetical protein